MRYYNIVITDPKSGKTVKQYTSFPNSSTDTGALDVELDVPVSPFGDPLESGAFVRVWGISMEDIAQSRNLNGMNIQVFAGMQKGLPLANPSQAGLIVQGQIFQAFANWIGVNMTLDMQILPGTSSATSANIVVNWPKGQTMASALTQALTAAFPAFKISVNINSSLVFTEGVWGVYQSLSQLAQWAKPFSRSIIGGSYAGISIFVQEKTIVVVDSSVQKSPSTISFNDLVGQVTWKAPNTVQITCVMRATPTVLDWIKLPPGQVTVNQASLSQFRQGSIFQGTFMITAARHVGAFRQPLAEAWITTYDAVPVELRKGTVEVSEIPAGG